MADFVRENLESILYGAGAVLLVYVAWRVLKPKPKIIGEGMKENVRCRGCSWQGVVTKYNRVCPQCGKSNFQQLGR